MSEVREEYKEVSDVVSKKVAGRVKGEGRKETGKRIKFLLGFAESVQSFEPQGAKRLMPRGAEQPRKKIIRCSVWRLVARSPECATRPKME